MSSGRRIRLFAAIAFVAASMHESFGAIIRPGGGSRSTAIIRPGGGSRRGGTPDLSPDKVKGKMPRIPADSITVPAKIPPQICKAMRLRELPPLRVPPFKCKRYFDWSAVSLVGAELKKPWSLMESEGKDKKSLEIILLQSLGGWKAPPQATQDKLFTTFPGSNHYLMYSKDRIPEVEAFNRLVLMASSSAVGLVRSGEEGVISALMVRRAAALFAKYKKLGVITFGSGLRGSVSFDAQDGMEYADAILSGPVFVRRSAFLKVGSLMQSCTEEARCWESSLLDLSLRMWEVGYSVGTAVASDAASEIPTSNKRHLLEEAGSMPYWLKKLREDPTPEEMEDGESDYKRMASETRTGDVRPLETASQIAESMPMEPKASQNRKKGAEAVMANSCASRLKPSVWSRLEKVSQTRQAFSDPPLSSADQIENGEKRRAIWQNWGDLRIRPPSIPMAICGSVNASSDEENRCPFEAPRVSMVLQYFKRPQNVQMLAQGIARTTNGLETELIINDDSRSDLELWLSELENANYDGNVFVSMSPNVHEIRGYNKLSKFATGTYLAHLQDDDIPNDSNWLLHALVLLNNQPKLAVLGGLRGRMDFGTIMDTRSNYINGPKYGAASSKRGCCKRILHWDAKSKIPFMNMYKVNLSPFILPRDKFLAMGMYHLHFSCAGHPGIGLDFELSIRAWRMGFQTGLYYSNFKLQVGQSRETGTRANKGLFNIRRNNELRNNKMMYTMYKGFHHKKGNLLAAGALRKLPAVKGWVPMNDMGGNKDFLKKHRGWYINNVINRSRRSDMDTYRKFLQEVASKGKGS